MRAITKKDGEVDIVPHIGAIYGASSGDSLVGEEVEKAKKKEGDEGYRQERWRGVYSPANR